MHKQKNKQRVTGKGKAAYPLPYFLKLWPECFVFVLRDCAIFAMIHLVRTNSWLGGFLVVKRAAGKKVLYRVFRANRHDATLLEKHATDTASEAAGQSRTLLSMKGREISPFLRVSMVGCVLSYEELKDNYLFS